MNTNNPYLHESAILYQVAVWGRGGNIPTFLLNSQIQGILNNEHAAEIALSMFPDCNSVTVMNYADGVAENFDRNDEV